LQERGPAGKPKGTLVHLREGGHNLEKATRTIWARREREKLVKAQNPNKQVSPDCRMG